MTHPIHDLTTYAGQYANIKAVKARIAAAAYKPAPKSSERVNKNSVPQEFPVPLWMREDTNFDWHVMSFKVQQCTSPHIKWMRKRCVELGVTYAQMVGVRGNDKIAKVRMRMYSEMKLIFPYLSLPRIGRAFGNRDHTSVLNGIRRWEKIKNEND